MRGRCWLKMLGAFFFLSFSYGLCLVEVLSLWVMEQMGMGCWSWCVLHGVEWYGSG